MLELDSPLVFSKYIQPACLPTNKPAPDSWCEVAGWGKTKATKNPSLQGVFGGFGSMNDIFNSVFDGFGRKKRDVDDLIVHQKKGEQKFPITSTLILNFRKKYSQKRRFIRGQKFRLP